MEANRRDSGLIRTVGTRSLAASIICIVVGAGIFAVPGALAASIGPYAPIAILICAIAIGSVAICFAEAGSRIASSGGVYGCIQAAFGPLTGYVAGMLLWIGNVLACGGVAVFPDDIIVVDDDGAVLIPQNLVEEVVKAAPEQERLEAWIMKEVDDGVALPGLYPPNEENLKRYNRAKGED